MNIYPPNGNPDQDMDYVLRKYNSNYCFRIYPRGNSYRPLINDILDPCLFRRYDKMLSGVVVEDKELSLGDSLKPDYSLIRDPSTIHPNHIHKYTMVDLVYLSRYTAIPGVYILYDHSNDHVYIKKIRQ